MRILEVCLEHVFGLFAAGWGVLLIVCVCVCVCDCVCLC
jgi:hypothetical protein